MALEARIIGRGGALAGLMAFGKRWLSVSREARAPKTNPTVVQMMTCAPTARRRKS